MLDVFKRILRDNYTVRQTEELARKIKGETQQKEPPAPKDQLWIPEQDQMAKEIEEKHTFDRVQIFQSSKLARLTLVIKGNPEVTSEKLKQIHDILTK
jgi:hypothetical protein